MSRARRRTRLRAGDWTEAALTLLAAEGPAALTINRLCAELGVTRGSFYWHFADLDALHATVTEHWCALTTGALDEVVRTGALTPVERLRSLTLRLLDPATAEVERALRDWARLDAEVAGLLAEADLAVLGTVTGALVELGRDPGDARVLAGLLVYAGIGFAHGQHGLPRPTPDEVDRLLAALLADPS